MPCSLNNTDKQNMNIKKFPKDNVFDVIIVGAGHAGCEASMACSRMGLSTLLLTSNADRIGHLSCNPAVGGLAKGHMVREIDALGGYTGYWTDKAAIQVRILNASKGPAVRATRAQVDREAYMQAVKQDIFAQPNLFVREEMVESLLALSGNITGVKSILGIEYFAKAVLLTTGTFLQGHIHIGNQAHSGGRLGDSASFGISKSLKEFGLHLKRFMTCTTPRILAESIDFSKMEPQYGDAPTPRFSPRSNVPALKQLPCFLTWTNNKTHEIIARDLHLSPMYSGAIPSAGPRYCPSIEDKIARFPDKIRHQIFIEPEGLHSHEYYPNGLPTGLPLSTQIEMLHSISGLEDCHVVRSGYAIEYDVVDTRQLYQTLECKEIAGLWTAGQINGTSGYEEAAAQGLWAAINIAAKILGQEAFLPKRDESYISVLIDDLTTKGTDEPYRMFTSRAEHRLLLRESNAHFRLTEMGKKYGLISDTHWDYFCQQDKSLHELLDMLQNTRLTPAQPLREFCEKHNQALPGNSITLGELLRRPGLDLNTLAELFPTLSNFELDIQAEAETICRYEGYVHRQAEMAKKLLNNDNVKIPAGIDYTKVSGLDLEGQEKLAAIKPLTLGQAGRISGISPAALACIEIHLKKIQMGSVKTETK